ncbi:DUF3293 domain-containing protein [Vibrio sp. TRT 17S01]|uniref:DUF3293 domain-containing protein n=1 Tax=Vibrio sp. TRT 17S01 TaxID=3418505 RepID=UPI003CEBF5FC
MIDAQLWQAYCDPYFRFERSVKFAEFAIITAWNPNSKWRSEKENCLNNQLLLQDINHNQYIEVVVGDEQFSWSEASFAVEMSRSEAICLARRYQQNAIYYVQREALWLLSCLSDRTELELGSWKQRLR